MSVFESFVKKKKWKKIFGKKNTHTQFDYLYFSTGISSWGNSV